MKIFRNRADLTPFLKGLRKKGSRIGFVPTMGALHTGHLSLITASKLKSDITVCSIFVNPTQFNDPKDLDKYPRPVERDIDLLIGGGCDILYLPEPLDVYPKGTAQMEKFDFSGIDQRLEGASRPGHFAGVAQVVKILLEIVQPDKMYLGQKDYQQFLILSDLVKQLKLKTKVVRCPIIREKNGLAMSSRNIRLSAEARDEAGIIFKTLKKTAVRLKQGETAACLALAIDELNRHPDFTVDYFELLHANNLRPVKKYKKNHAYILITSVIVEGVRLLDNLLIGKENK